MRQVWPCSKQQALVSVCDLASSSSRGRPLLVATRKVITILSKNLKVVQLKPRKHFFSWAWCPLLLSSARWARIASARASDQASDLASERPIERSIERSIELSSDRAIERAIERSSDRAIERAIERSSERSSDRAIDKKQKSNLEFQSSV